MSRSIFEEDAIFKCQTCCKRFFTKLGLKIHSKFKHKHVTLTDKDQGIENKVVTENRLTALKQDTGDETKITQSKLDFFTNVNGTELKLLKCDVSDGLFDKMNGSTSEINKGRKTYQCQNCEKMYSRPLMLREHRNAVHEKLKPYQCRVCEKAFGFTSGLHIHIKAVHKKLRPHQCQLCTASFGRKAGLKIHTISVHEKSTHYP